MARVQAETTKADCEYKLVCGAIAWSTAPKPTVTLRFPPKK